MLPGLDLQGLGPALLVLVPVLLAQVTVLVAVLAAAPVQAGVLVHLDLTLAAPGAGVQVLVADLREGGGL